jgi:hypothetical protein
MSKPFDLASALNGKAVQTMTGLQVTRLSQATSCGEPCLTGVISHPDGTSFVSVWSSTGQSVITRDYHLVMKTTKKTLFYNVFMRERTWRISGQSEHYLFMGATFDSKECADREKDYVSINSKPRRFIRTDSIQIEE